MAENATENNITGIKNLLWGPGEVRTDIFKRWSQGFYFSETEKSALEQSEGGPCAIIAPVQAYIIKNLLLEYSNLSFREQVTNETQNQYLVSALVEILALCNVQKYHIVYLSDEFREKEEASRIKSDASDAPRTSTCDPVLFHDNLRVEQLPSIFDVRKYYLSHIEDLKGQYGLLMFLYSVILSRGLEQVKSESDTQDPLIDATYGYGSQSLINLMITGRATTYVWDNDQDVGGLRLQGIERQSQIGFITIMEHLRFCTVGNYYKNPVHPVWVLASDTHLTVLYSDEKKLVSPETKSEMARRVFKNFDPDGNNFIKANLLQDVLQSLELVSEKDYVDIMKKKLDEESLGIILLDAFMHEFFPKEESSTPDMFTLIHYNGLAQSNMNGQVQYHVGSAILLESDLKSICESNPMLTVLQTKWPNIEVNWFQNVTPSLN
ncbi:ubiquitin carboxyl-terminal hydrolase MINDY-3 homolog [Aethina tumida]|uniref:ubiquitin carboxyl-terminal hydrolase MINDY-3 homolog n=1 Tax=Aethina tumida TaxID=116153 RepID=UPI00096B3392|nr:ubiquitin carboxyl-terminal hydrolase MINDY-3 homolog [Aethina tumida]